MGGIVSNGLSASRLILAVAFPVVPGSWRAWVILGAGLSDLIDGLYSRLSHTTSITGQVLDPIADKLFMASVLITLLVEGRFAPWQAALVAFRDLAVLAGSGTTVVRSGWSALRHMPPSWLGKLTTAGQFALVLALVAYRPAAPLLFWPTAVLSILAGLHYLSPRRPGGEGTAATARPRH